MAISFDVSANGFTRTIVNDGSNNTSILVNVPTTVANGDLMISVIHCNAVLNPSSISPPSGWTEVANNFNLNGNFNAHTWVGWKIASGEPANYSWTIGADTRDDQGWILRVTGHDPVSPIDSVGTFGGDIVLNPIANQITTASANAMAVWIVGGKNGSNLAADDTSIKPTQATQIVYKKTRINSSGVGSCIAYELRSSAGATGTRTFTGAYQTTASYASTIGFAIKEYVAPTPNITNVPIIYANSSNVVVTGTSLENGAYAKLVYDNQEILMIDYVANSTQPYFTSPSLADVFASRIQFTDSANLQILNAQSGIVATKIVSFQPDANVKLVHNVTDITEAGNTGSIYYGQSPAITVSDQIVYDKKSSLLANVSIDSLGYFSIDYSNTTIGNDSFGYRVFETTSQVWGTEGIISTIVPTDVISRAFRVVKSLDGKRYSRYTDGSGPRYAATIIVRNQQQLNSALSLSNTALSGQVIGVEYNATPYFIDDTIISDKSFASGLTICHYGSRMPEFNFIKIKGLVNTKISGIDLYKTSNGTCLTINSGTDNFTLEYCKIHSTYWDPNGNYGAYEPSSNQSSGIKLVSSGAGANIANVYIMNNQIYNVLEGLTTSQGYTGDFHFIGNEVYNMYTGALAFGPQNPNTGTTKINWNFMYSPYGKSSDTNIGLGTPPHVDFIQARVVQKDWTLDVIGNILIPGNSRGGNTVQCIFMDDNHRSDIRELQITTGAGGSETGNVTLNGISYAVPLTTGNTQQTASLIANRSGGYPGYTTSVSGNTVSFSFPAERTGAFSFSSSGSATGIMYSTQLGGNTTFYTANVIGNLCITNSTHAISILQSKNSRVIGNSVLPTNSSATIGARVNIGTGTDSYPDGNGGGNIVKNTVAESINGVATETNNYEYASYSAVVLATLFVGPTFSGSDWYTKQGALSAASMKVGGPLDLATNIGAVGTGYVDFTARTINTAME